MPLIFLLILSILCQSCDFNTRLNATETESNNPPVKISGESISKPENVNYNWLKKDQYDQQLSLANQIVIPAGYERVKVEPGSFAEWLRFLPLKTKNEKVMLFDGRVKPYQAGAERVINIDIGNADLQQCADAIMRLKAEYHFSKKEFSKIHFNFTSGHKVSFDNWIKGIKPVISGNKVSFSGSTGTTDDSYSNFRKYMNSIFNYAGTASLEKELKTQSIAALKAGDVFIKGGFPGHAVIVLDVAVNKKTGKKIFLLAQSYMPAQSIHVLKNLGHQSNLSPWYSEDFGELLETPEWDFKAASLKKFND
jgi:hypothetical protein